MINNFSSLLDNKRAPLLRTGSKMLSVDVSGTSSTTISFDSNEEFGGGAVTESVIGDVVFISQVAYIILDILLHKTHDHVEIIVQALCQDHE
ncbi:hypothetical protein TNCV_2385991 [Trichonephila clavipes]|nr:hypothetical protein TNCV_2385991 [Trichonephila clavipes]